MTTVWNVYSLLARASAASLLLLCIGATTTPSQEKNVKEAWKSYCEAKARLDRDRVRELTCGDQVGRDVLDALLANSQAWIDCRRAAYEVILKRDFPIVTPMPLEPELRQLERATVTFAGEEAELVVDGHPHAKLRSVNGRWLVVKGKGNPRHRDVEYAEAGVARAMAEAVRAGKFRTMEEFEAELNRRLKAIHANPSTRPTTRVAD